MLGAGLFLCKPYSVNTVFLLDVLQVQELKNARRRCNANAFIVHDMQSNRRLLAGSLLHRERGFSFSTVLSKLLAACPSFLTTIHQSVNHHLSSHTFSTQLCSGVRCWKSAYCIKRFLKFVCICIFL